MYLFHSPDCEECQDIKKNYLPRLSEKYPSLKVKTLDISDLENYQLMLRFEKTYGEIKNSPPTILIDGQILDGEKEIKERLGKVIEAALLKGGCSWPEPGEKDKTEELNYGLVTDRFKRLGILPIIGAGLLDGINPCAFATIIFLVSCQVDKHG